MPPKKAGNSTDKKKDDKSKDKKSVEKEVKDKVKDKKETEKKSKDPKADKNKSKDIKEDKKKVEDKKSKDKKKEEDNKSKDKKVEKSKKDEKPANKEEKPKKEVPKKRIDRGIPVEKNPVSILSKPQVEQKDSVLVKELKLYDRFKYIEGMNLIEEQETDDYFDNTKLDNYLVLSIREVIRGRVLPKNPFPRILRSLKQSLWYNTSLNDINKRMEAHIDNFIEKHVEEYNIYTLKRDINAFGYRHILNLVNIDTIIFLKKYMFDYINKKYERRQDYDVLSSYCCRFSLTILLVVHSFSKDT